MRPFLLSYLKCTKCGSTSPPKLAPRAIEKTAMPNTVPSLKFYNAHSEHLMDLVDSLSTLKGGVIDVDEADVYGFLDGADEAPIARLLYGIDVLGGSVSCTECGDEKQIKDGILFCEE